MSNVPMTLPQLAISIQARPFGHNSSYVELEDGRIIHCGHRVREWSDDGGLTWSQTWAEDQWMVDTNGDRYACECFTRAGAGKRVIGRLSGLVDREVAASLRDFKLVIEKDALPAPAENEFYFHQVIGMSVWADGTRRGEIIGVHATSAYEVFEIQTPTGSVFVPAIRESVVSLDMVKERLDLIAGPFEEE